MDKRDYYEVLGIDKSASQDEIKRAFRRQAVKLHPDKQTGDEAKFKELNEAYEVLGNEQKKQAYDQYGHAAGAEQAGGGQNPYGQGNPFGDFGSQFYGDINDLGGMGDLNDFLSNMYKRATQNMTRDKEEMVIIDFSEAVTGTSRNINGTEVKVPAGIDDEQTLKIPGKGEVNRQGQRGDLYVHIRVRPHKSLRREGPNIISEITLDMADAALGTEVDVETLDGEVTVKIPAGSGPGKVVKISGEGMPIIGTNRKGDHLIAINVEVPKKLSSKQRKALEDYQKATKKHFW